MTTPKDTWISVKDAMPDFDTDHIFDYQLLICFSASKIVTTAEFDSTNFRDESGYYISENDVSHWILLSKPKTK